EGDDVEALARQRLRLDGGEGPLSLHPLGSDGEGRGRHELRDEVPPGRPLLGGDEDVGTRVGAVTGAEERDAHDVVPVQMADEDRPGERIGGEQPGEHPYAGARIENELRLAV